MSDQVIQVVEQSNQRGGRMLSVIDLIAAGTIDPKLCSWVLEHLLGGGSLMVGARPGGAGKTTVMSAFLTMLPRDTRVRVARPGSGWEQARPGECVVAYEISPGAYDGYIWGESVRRLAELGTQGVQIITNLHADTIGEARDQIVEECGATREQLAAFGLFLPIDTAQNRVIRKPRFHADGKWRTMARSAEPSRLELEMMTWLTDMARRGVVAVEDVREEWLRWVDGRVAGRLTGNA